MDHSEWAKQVKAAMALKCESPRSAVSALKSLRKKVARVTKSGLSDWHIEQTQSLEAIILSESNDHKAAAVVCRRINRQLRAQLTYYARALASSLAFEAFELSDCGQGRRARSIATEAMGFFKEYPEASATYNRLVELLARETNMPKTNSTNKATGA